MMLTNTDKVLLEWRYPDIDMLRAFVYDLESMVESPTIDDQDVREWAADVFADGIENYQPMKEA